MAKSNTAMLDKTVAAELNLSVSERTLTLKHVVPFQGVEGFYFVFIMGQQHWIDFVPIWRISMGLRKRPERFFLPTSVRLRLQQHAHVRWYMADSTTLYPVQQAKVEKLDEMFWMVDDPDPTYRPTPLVNVELFYLRKKPLLPMRQQPRWETIKDPYVIKNTS